ncbi:hypothetical protein [Streptomyces shenzhenensis]|uniref:hypothetical protein n=1 Tax=Streptomyces shenzhenensis TaxID=943815 RepID=UPI0038D49C04
MRGVARALVGVVGADVGAVVDRLPGPAVRHRDADGVDRVQPRRAKVARLRHAMRMRTFRW